MFGFAWHECFVVLDRVVGMLLGRGIPVCGRIDVSIRFFRQPQFRHQLIVKHFDRRKRRNADVCMIEPKEIHRHVYLRKTVIAIAQSPFPNMKVISRVKRLPVPQTV
jgi:hypothetical protein